MGMMKLYSTAIRETLGRIISLNVFSLLFHSLRQANMRVKAQGTDESVDVGQPVDYQKLLTQVRIRIRPPGTGRSRRFQGCVL